MFGYTEVSFARFGDRVLQKHEFRFRVIGKHQQTDFGGVLEIQETMVNRTGQLRMGMKYHNGNRFYCPYPPPYLDTLFMTETFWVYRVDVDSVQFGHDEKVGSVFA